VLALSSAITLLTLAPPTLALQRSSATRAPFVFLFQRYASLREKRGERMSKNFDEKIYIISQDSEGRFIFDENDKVYIARARK